MPSHEVLNGFTYFRTAIPVGLSRAIDNFDNELVLFLANTRLNLKATALVVDANQKIRLDDNGKEGRGDFLKCLDPTELWVAYATLKRLGTDFRCGEDRECEQLSGRVHAI